MLNYYNNIDSDAKVLKIKRTYIESKEANSFNKANRNEGNYLLENFDYLKLILIWVNYTDLP